jgi:transglutaminase-like putative cysteine protease
VQGPLWALPQDARGGVSGLSDSMAPGSVSSLIQSDALAFRVQFLGERPAYSALYFRGPVLTEFDGVSWRMWGAPQKAKLEESGRFEYSSRSNPVRYALTLEPHNKTWLFALDVPDTVPEKSYLLADLQIRSRAPVDERRRYELTSWLTYRYGESMGPVQQKWMTRFEEDRNPRTLALGRQWAQENPEPHQLVARAMQLFNRQFVYTLEPPLLDPRDPYDDFLFTSKRGFCEHFAGSFALLMRAAGVPTRIVTGYQGGEVNPFNNELIVRQADAHAWAEVWYRDEGWVRVDPTAAVSPTRVENGVNAALGPIGVTSSIIAGDPLGLLSRLRYGWQMMNSQWEQWVVGYNVDRQRQFFSDLGFPAIDWRILGFWLVIAVVSVGGAISVGLLVRDRAPRREASLVAWNRFCAKMAAAGLPREAHEGPLDYLARVRAARPGSAAAAEEITRRYVEARYGAGATRDELRQLAARVREFRASTHPA